MLKVRMSWPVSAPEPLSALAGHFPAIHRELLRIFSRLEKHYRDMCEHRVHHRAGQALMLQTRVGKRTGTATLKMAVDMTRDFRLSREGRPAAGHRGTPRRGPASPLSSATPAGDSHRPAGLPRCCGGCVCSRPKGHRGGRPR